ncbi:MAG: hypothetical protein Q9200_006823 [Gallowayella weberi]
MSSSRNAVRSLVILDNYQPAERQPKDHNANRENVRSSPRKPVEVYEDDDKRPGLHKKTKSSVSLKSLIGNDRVKSSKPPTLDSDGGTKLKRPKSSTSLSALLSRSKPPKEPKPVYRMPAKDKENRTPPQTADMLPPPIWAQFATQQSPEPLTSAFVPQKDERQIALHALKEYSPSKQPNSREQQPKLSRKTETRSRPQSVIISSPAGMESKKVYNPLAGGSTRVITMENQRPVLDADPESTEARPATDRGLAEVTNGVPSSAAAKVKQGSRVMAAVAAFNGTRHGACDAHQLIPAPSGLDAQAIETEFETLLESRNIPDNVRDRMRSLNTNIKIDFIRKEKNVSVSVSSTESQASAEPRDTSRKRPNLSGQVNEEGKPFQIDRDLADKTDDEGSPKKRRSRPRSRTFTFSKGDSSPKKKEKPEASKSRGRSRSRNRGLEEVVGPETLEGRSRSFSLSRAPKPANPQDFLSYLQKTQRPEDVEVGRLQKLRQLLRNETVVWVDGFISQGGMMEIIGLLDRILKVEWREEHEDALLHETLLCLKAMCTTSVAVAQLSKLTPTLFPTLLGMLFDEQRKGPSEFATRNVVMSLLFIHLTAASATQYETRAREIIRYLRNPSKPEDSLPPDFIAQMHSPRHYHVWCNEMVNVTKEVFWIFLHHANVIPYPKDINYDKDSSYRQAHFPPDRVPIPAAPYIGGVEWDATHYLATHLDLLNGLIACLPTREERNKLRQELKDSGFEKCMGGSLRTCKEKWYGYVHTCLTTWVSAGLADGWDIQEVREGPKREETTTMSPKKRGKKVEDAPQLEMPKLDSGIGYGKGDEGGWL